MALNIEAAPNRGAVGAAIKMALNSDDNARSGYHRDADAAREARHAEVARRYALVDATRPKPADSLTVTMRARELRSFLSHRYGDALPDDDAGRDDLALLLGYVMQLNPGRAVPAMIAEARAWAPWLDR